MKYLDSFIYDNGESRGSKLYDSKLYQFLATNYDISNLAKKINATKNAKINLLNLKKMGNITNL